MKPLSLILAALVMLAMAVSSAFPAGEQIKWQVIAGGGQRGTSPSYVLNGTVGQAAAGPGSSPSYKLNGGFWQNFGSGSCCIGVRGNVDCDPGQSVDIADLTVLVDNLFITFTPLCCPTEADMVIDNSIDIADLTFLVDNLFITFPPQPGC